MGEEKPFSKIVLSALVGGVLSGSLLSAVFGYVIFQNQIEIEQQIHWKEKVLSGLLGPVCMQLDRTNRAFKRWKTKNLYLEAKIIKESNTIIRDLLLKNGHLIPIHLMDDAGRLIEHYDVWLEQFEKKRGGKEPDVNSQFVYAGPEGYGFPNDAEENFNKACDAYKTELFGEV